VRRGETARMRNRALHDALRDFTLEAAALLSSQVDGGHEVPFELVEEPGSGPVLYRYRPLTERYIAERWSSLRALPSCERAKVALGSGAQAYLRVQGITSSGADAEPALQAMLERLWDDASSFGFPEERYERVYAEVERTLYEHTLSAAVVAPLHGVELERERVELGDGLVLIAGTGAEAPPEAVWPLTGDRERGALPNTLVLLERDVPSGEEPPVTEARVRFRRLLSAMRLYKPGGVSLGPLAWARADAGPWQPLPLAPSGFARGEPWVLNASEEAGLRELNTVLDGSRPAGPVGWALSRFEMGCERTLDAEALSDYLLALRAMLERDEDGGSFLLRVAALCAEEPDRPELQRRIECALELERFVSGREPGDDYLERVGPEPPRTIVLGVEDNLRAILQDVVCGYLDSDLRAVADEILLSPPEPDVIEARDLREPESPPPAPDPEPAPVEEPSPEEELEPVAESDEESHNSGVTRSADWELDEDPASYSAPV
jgi:hypothetical protein